jgi:hypothetical protein
MSWENTLVSVTVMKRAAINSILSEWGDVTLGVLATKTPYEIMRLPKCGPISARSVADILARAKAGEDVRHPMHKPIGEPA